MDTILGSSVDIVKIPFRAPNANSHAERYVLSCREECLNHLVLFGLNRLQYVVDCYTSFYNQHRPHQGIGNRIPAEYKRNDKRQGGTMLEGYSTCICPYNYKTSLALIPVERNENWSVYLAGGRREKMAANKARNKDRKKGRKTASLRAKAEVETVRTLRINFNAPGDQMDADGKLWLAWPRPVDPKKVYLIRQVPIQVETEWTGFRFNSNYHPIANTKTPWLYTSGLTGSLKLDVRLSEGQPGQYRVAGRAGIQCENTGQGCDLAVGHRRRCGRCEQGSDEGDFKRQSQGDYQYRVSSCRG